MGLIDGLWNTLLGDPKKPGGNKPVVKAAAREATLGGKGKGKAAAGGGDARAQALEAIRANQARVMTPEREKLISDAMAVHRAKQKILADLSDDDRRKLMVTAMRALLNEGKDTEGR